MNVCFLEKMCFKLKGNDLKDKEILPFIERKSKKMGKNAIFWKKCNLMTQQRWTQIRFFFRKNVFLKERVKK